MRVLFINEFTKGIGGVNRVVDLEIGALRNQGVDVSLFSYGNDEFDSADFLGKTTTLAGAVRRKFMLKELRSQSAQFSPDVVHIHNIYPLLAGGVIRFLNSSVKIPLVMHLHNYHPFCLNSYFFTGGNVCTRCYDRDSWRPGLINRCYDHSFWKTLYVSSMKQKPSMWLENVATVDKFIAVSNFVKAKYVEAGIPSKKIEVIHNPLDTDYENNDLREDGEYVLYIGSLLKEKGLLTLLKAAKALHDIKFVIAGEGRDKAAFLDFSKGMVNVMFVGPVSGDKKRKIFQNAKFVVVPSECWESCSLVPVEANSFGKQVVASRTGGIVELIQDGTNGLFFEPGDWQGLAGRIKELWYNKHTAETADLCREKALRFSMRSHLTKLMAAYTGLL